MSDTDAKLIGGRGGKALGRVGASRIADTGVRGEGVRAWAHHLYRNTRAGDGKVQYQQVF